MLLCLGYAALGVAVLWVLPRLLAWGTEAPSTHGGWSVRALVLLFAVAALGMAMPFSGRIAPAALVVLAAGSFLLVGGWGFMTAPPLLLAAWLGWRRGA